MKLQIDANNKTIKVEEDVNLFEFIEVVHKTIHPDVLKEYKLITGSIIEWNNPIIIYRDQWHYPLYPINPYPLSPPYWVGDLPLITEPYSNTCGCNDSIKQDVKPDNFVFNIEIK